jgi:hypothetical protein
MKWNKETTCNLWKKVNYDNMRTSLNNENKVRCEQISLKLVFCSLNLLSLIFPKLRENVVIFPNSKRGVVHVVQKGWKITEFLTDQEIWTKIEITTQIMLSMASTQPVLRNMLQFPSQFYFLSPRYSFYKFFPKFTINLYIFSNSIYIISL